jgi:hypothetical protein
VHRLMNVPDEVHDEFQRLCPLFSGRFLVREDFYKVGNYFNHATPWRRTVTAGVIRAPERNVHVMPRRSVPALSTDVIRPVGDGIQVIAADERLDHDLRGLIQVILGDGGNDPVTVTTPTPAEWWQE